MKKEQMVRRPKNNEIYQHFKGNLYKIITLAKDSETDEELVVYQALYGDYSIYVRSLSLFTERLDKHRYPQAEQTYRFEPAQQLVSMDWEERDILVQEKEEIGEKKAETKETKEPGLDPLLEQFLEANTYRERLNILRGLEHRITQGMINTMAIVMDLDIPDGDLEERFHAVEASLLTLERYECTRLR